MPDVLYAFLLYFTVSSTLLRLTELARLVVEYGVSSPFEVLQPL